MAVDKNLRDLQLAYKSATYHDADGGDLSLSPGQVVALVTPPTSGTTTVTLPSVGDAEGRFYSVISNGNDVGTIEVVGDGSERTAFAPAALTADGDRLLCYSDGYEWYAVSLTAT